MSGSSFLLPTNPLRLDLELVQVEYSPYPDSMRMEFAESRLVMVDLTDSAVIVVGYGEGEWEKAQQLLDLVNEDFLQSGIKKISITYNALTLNETGEI